MKPTVVFLEENVNPGGGVASVIYALINRWELPVLYFSRSRKLAVDGVDSVLFPTGTLWLFLVRVAFSLMRRGARKDTIIYCHQPRSLLMGWAVSRVVGCHLIYHCHGIPEISTRFRRGLFRLAVRHSSQVIAISDFVRRSLEEFGATSSEITVVPNSLPYDIPTSVPDPSKRDIDFAFVGRICEEKDPMFFVDLLESLEAPEVCARIIGKVEDEEYMAKLEERLEHRPGVEYLGLLPPAEVMELLRRTKVLVVPSNWGEPFGLVVLEGFACGAIVLARRDGAMPEQVRKFASGFLFSDLSEALQKIEEIKELDYEHAADNDLQVLRNEYSPSAFCEQIQAIMQGLK